MDFFGTVLDDVLEGQESDDFLLGNAGNDSLVGGAGNDQLVGGNGSSVNSGRDTLEGGIGDDGYVIGLDGGGGSQIEDTAGIDVVLILAENTNLSELNTSESFADASLYGNSAIALTFPQAGVVGIAKSETDLIIDINRDGIAERNNDLTIINFFNAEGQLGGGSVELINNIINTQTIVDFFNISPEANSIESAAVYRFFNNDTGVHFYTSDILEKNAVQELSNFSFEGASYESIDPLTGGGVPVYRFLNQETGVHLYTISEVEREATDNLSNYSFEGEVFFAYATEEEGSIPVYRFFNSNTGAHFYTPSAAERDNVIENLSDFQSEGIAYYALPSFTEIDTLL